MPPSAATADAPWFTDVTAAAGLDFLHDSGLSPERHLPETMGAGAALIDVDGDDDLDLYLLQGGPFPPAPPGGKAPPTSPANALYLNDGSGRFSAAGAAAGAAAHTGYAMAVATGDVDGDGDTDLFVTNFGPDVLLLNDGAGRFTEATPPVLADPRWTSSAAFFDADNDGDLDLYVSAYVDIDVAAPTWCGDRRPGWRSYCHPDVYAGLPDRFYRNDGRGGFTEATAAAGLESPPGRPGKGLGVLPFDADADGDLDLYVANDSVENRLWINTGDGRFEDGTLISGTGTNARGLSEAGMGVAAGDVDGDGDLDLFVTNFDDESNTLYRNDGAGLFTDVTVSTGLEAPSRIPVGFGTVLADFDHDGDLDLAVTNGHIIDNVELYFDGKTHAQTSQLFSNDGLGRFTDVTARAGGLSARPLVGRGLYAGDLDGDGDLDLVVTQCGGPALLLRNDRAPPGTGIVVAGIPPGTRVVATTPDGTSRVREVTAAGSYYGAGPARLHLALPTTTTRFALQLATPGSPLLERVVPARGGPLHVLVPGDAGLTWR